MSGGDRHDSVQQEELLRKQFSVIIYNIHMWNGRFEGRGTAVYEGHFVGHIQ